MNPELSKLLGAYIADLYPQIQDLPMCVDKKTAKMFNFNPRAKLDVSFGPDIESLLWDENKLISGFVNGSLFRVRFTQALELIKKVKQDCGTDLYKESGKDFDASKIEFRLAPKNPEGIVNAFKHLKYSFESNAKSEGLKPHFGLTQHWHMSLNQETPSLLWGKKQKPLLQDGRNKTPFFTTTKSFDLLQQSAPALFIEPGRLEDPEFQMNCAIHGMGVDNDSIRTKEHSSIFKSHYTIEPRFGTNDAEQPVALYLSALLWGMKTYPQYNLGRITKMEESPNWKLNTPMGSSDFPKPEGFEFSFGDGAFGEMLEKTVQSKKAREMMPTQIFNALVVDAACRYGDFLRTSEVKYENEETRKEWIERSDQIALDHS